MKTRVSSGCKVDAAVELRDLTDDELIACIEDCDAGRDRLALTAALDELFGRLRADAAPDEGDYVEAVIAYLRATYSQRDEDGPDNTGVREPRRPSPPGGRASVALDPRGRVSDAA